MTDQSFEVRRFNPNNKDYYRTELEALFLCYKFYSNKKKDAINFFFHVESKKDLINYKDLDIFSFYMNDIIYGFATSDKDAEEKEVQVFMMPKKRFKGYGLIFILALEKYLYNNYKKLKSVYAQCNSLSRNTFEDAGYIQAIDGDFYKNIRF